MPTFRTLTRSNILAEAREWIGTPWRHQHHRKHVACDCIGLIVETLRACGFAECENFRYPNYDRVPHGLSLERKVDLHLKEKPIEKMLPGDVALIAWRQLPMHLAFISNYGHDRIDAPHGLVHSMVIPGYVREHILDAEWTKRIKRLYTVPGVV